METPASFDHAALSAFVSRHWGSLTELRIRTRTLRGGLESPAVLAVEARFRDRWDRLRCEAFVVKLLSGEPAREACIYERLVTRCAADLAPALLGVERLEAGGCLLVLEKIRPVRRWPWRDPAAARDLIVRLAWLHASAPMDEAAASLPAWDYEGELHTRAAAAVEILEGLPRDADFTPLRRSLPSLRRVAGRLPEMRLQLLALPGLGLAVLHGDVHPGNAMVRRRHARDVPVLLDWGRARIGSPLEDVASWLQSLGFWELEARRRHDTLLGAYLEARGLPPRADRALRDAYWIAAASNVLAGALLIHLWTARDLPAGSPARARAAQAARAALRIIRRAEACWRAAPRTAPRRTGPDASDRRSPGAAPLPVPIRSR